MLLLLIFNCCNHWNNSCCYRCHHTDMTSYQISALHFFICFCWFASMLPPSSFTASRIFSFILHYRSAFDSKFIWKRYATFSFIQFIFVMVKDKGIMSIFQGASLSVMLFVLCLNPLSFLLNKWKGYSFGRDRKLQHTHNFFVDDLKLYSQDLNSTKKHSYIITTFFSDIDMRFGEDKCAYLQIEKRKVM